MIETDVNVLNSLGLTANAEAQANKAGNKDMGQADFLELMLTQIKHQNPLDPMEGEEFVAQLAQFSTVQGIETLNASFSSVAAALQSDQFLQASGLVGQDVLVPSNAGYLDPDTGLKGRVDLPQAAQNLTVEIYDQSDNLVRTLPLGAREQGSVDFAWEGLDDSGTGLQPGIYKIVAKDTENDAASAFVTHALFPVEGVIPTQDGGSMLLSLPGIGTVPFDQVSEIH